MNVLVLGCGRVGEGVARELGARAAQATVVDRDPSALERLGAGFSGRKELGSILHRDVLTRAGIADTDAVAVVTGSDEVNAVVALTARSQFRVPTVVARLNDPRVADIHLRLGIRTLSPATWGIQRIADLVTASSVHPTVALGTGGVEVVEVRVPALLDGSSAGELSVLGEIDVIAVTRHGRTSIATSATPLKEGDLAHVAVATASIGRLERLLAHA